MKRDPRLAGLSSEHHLALVLARAVTTHEGPWTPADGAELGRRFDAEIESHFRLEEELLLPALRSAGAAALADRTAADHAFLRDRLTAARTGDAPAAAAFAARLVEHVRFEEREVFPACEILVPGPVLDEVARRALRKYEDP